MARRRAWIEAARTLACGLVVLVHVNLYIRAGMETWWPGGFGGVPFFALAVPIFFVIAGYVADVGMGSQETHAGWLGRRLQRLLPPFFAWNLLTLLVLTLSGDRPNTWQVALQLATGTWHLYFIFALVQLLALHAMLRHPLMTHLRLLLGLAVGSTVAMFATSEVLLWTSGADSEGFEIHGKKVFLVWGGFYTLGVWWHRRGPLFESLRRTIVLGALALVAYAAYRIELRFEDQVFGYTPLKQLLLGGLPFQFLGAIALIVYLQQWEQSGRMRGLLQGIGRPGIDTFGIYLSHIVVLALLWKAWELAGAVRMSWLEVPLFTAATWLSSFLLVRAVRAINIPWLSLIFLGERPTHSRAGISMAPVETGAAVR